MPTQLTISLSDDLTRRAEARAALEGATLADVIRELLEDFAAGLDLLEEAEDIRVVSEIEARIARGEEQLFDWEDVEARLDALPD